MADKITLFVNGVEVEVESGKNLIDAVAAAGIEIPHLCYHPALGADGNCRMCLVGIEDGRPPLVPACKTPAQAGMKVLLDAAHIRKIQHDVMEFELINHPIDCPICDQAGECKLQDYYMGYHGQSSRMTVPQVQKSKKLDFGCGVVHDQERCITCGRCVRFCRQITKTGELGIINRSDQARVNIFPGRPLNNRYALNIVDLCPVGAMTSADFRFQQRVWFLKKSPSVCHGCSKGCNLYIDHHREKYGDDRIYRFRPRHNPQVNGYFLCDEGRLSYRRENEQRLTEARIGGQPVALADALAACRAELQRGQKTVILLSPSASLEQMLAVKEWANKLGATLSGFSDGYIKPGDGDGYLIQDDKAANRLGLSLLGIDTRRDRFETALAEAQLFINFDNELEKSFAPEELTKLLKACKTIFAVSHDSPTVAQADIAIPLASFSEYDGTVINCDQVVQSFKRAVQKNSPPLDLAAVVGTLGEFVTSRERLFSSLAAYLPLLKEHTADTVPAQGLKLNESEAAHVSA